MNKINSLLSDSHLDLNSVICDLDPMIADKLLGDDFDSKYAFICLSNIRSALVACAVLIQFKLPFEQREEFFKKLLEYEVISVKEFNYCLDIERLSMSSREISGCR